MYNKCNCLPGPSEVSSWWTWSLQTNLTSVGAPPLQKSASRWSLSASPGTARVLTQCFAWSALYPLVKVTQLHCLMVGLPEWTHFGKGISPSQQQIYLQSVHWVPPWTLAQRSGHQFYRASPPLCQPDATAPQRERLRQPGWPSVVPGGLTSPSGLAAGAVSCQAPAPPTPSTVALGFCSPGSCSTEPLSTPGGCRASEKTPSETRRGFPARTTWEPGNWVSHLWQLMEVINMLAHASFRLLSCVHIISCPSALLCFSICSPFPTVMLSFTSPSPFINKMSLEETRLLTKSFSI